MAKKQMTKGAKRRLTLLTPIVILSLGYLIFTLATTVIQLYQLHVEEQNLQAELKDLKGDSEELKNEITKLQDKDYVARYARENYLYTKDGEYVIKSFDSEEKTDTSELEIDEEYLIYGGIVLGSFVIFYVIVKHFKRKRKKRNKSSD